MRLRPTAYTPGPYTEPDVDLAARIARLANAFTGRPLVVLTGAGISTDSGIPDYRSPDATPRTPMTYQQFLESDESRRRYWARNHVGWRHMERAQPNASHAIVARLERLGIVTAVITQNVDCLHQRAGSRQVVDLHGTYARVVCLSCRRTMSRAALADVLEPLNPHFAPAVQGGAIDVAPDADAEVVGPERFHLVGCLECGGHLKPDIVYFGENVPVERVERCYQLVDAAGGLLVLGSSLTVMSGLRFVKRAARASLPIGILNRGPTRGDDLATVTIDAPLSASLPLLEQALLASR